MVFRQHLFTASMLLCWHSMLPCNWLCKLALYYNSSHYYAQYDSTSSSNCSLTCNLNTPTVSKALSRILLNMSCGDCNVSVDVLEDTTKENLTLPAASNSICRGKQQPHTVLCMQQQQRQKYSTGCLARLNYYNLLCCTRKNPSVFSVPAPIPHGLGTQTVTQTRYT